MPNMLRTRALPAPAFLPVPGWQMVKPPPRRRKGAVTSGGKTMYQQALDKVSKQVLIRERYDNFIGGKWVAPVEGKYCDNPSPITGKRLCQIPRSTAADIELALDAAHKAKDAWVKTPVQERSRLRTRSPTRSKQIWICW